MDELWMWLRIIFLIAFLGVYINGYLKWKKGEYNEH